MDLIPALASAASMFSESATVKNIKRRMSKRNMAVSPVSWPNPMRAIGAQNLLTMPGGVKMSGYLHKKGGSQFSLMRWPLRYIIIHEGCVYYFKTSTSPTPQGAFSLNGYNRVMRAAEETTSTNVFPFKIVHFSKKHRTWYFSAASEDERRRWMRNLRKEIDHYNDKKDFLVISDSDSDADSFYGQIESTVNINNHADHPDSEYILQDEDSDDDYLEPDAPPTIRATVPPPSYPPPPVPSQELSYPCRPKIPPPPLPCPPKKSPPCPLSKKPTTSSPGPNILVDPVLNKGPPPPLPASLQKPILNRGPGITSSSILSSPLPSCPKKPAFSSPSVATLPTYEKKPCPPVVLKMPSTLPICHGLDTKLHLNGENKLGLLTIHNPNLGSRSADERRSNSPTPIFMKHSVKPPVLGPKPKPSRPSLQRSSPDGQSFRSSVEENPLKKRTKSKNVNQDSDDDYENVQLPDSVFVDTTDTSAVEKLFKDTSSSPRDGLYCIRNSGTKTSKVLVVWDVSLNKARNYRVFEEDSHVFLESELTFQSLAALVEHYYSHPLPNHGSLCLQQPYGYTAPR